MPCPAARAKGGESNYHITEWDLGLSRAAGLAGRLAAVPAFRFPGQGITVCPRGAGKSGCVQCSNSSLS